MSLAHRPRFEQHYREGNTPWDTHQTPPEVIAFWLSGTLPWSGIALDLGCGPGTNVRYLARLGLSAVGVDFVGLSLATAQARIQSNEPLIAERTHLLLADVTSLPFVGLGARYILDVGCFHGIPPEVREGYVSSVLSNLAPGGYYHLFAYDRVAELEEDPDRIRGVTDNEVEERFAPDLRVVRIERARPDRYPCRWYLLQRIG